MEKDLRRAYQQIKAQIKMRLNFHAIKLPSQEGAGIREKGNCILSGMGIDLGSRWKGRRNPIQGSLLLFINLFDKPRNASDIEIS